MKMYRVAGVCMAFLVPALVAMDSSKAVEQKTPQDWVIEGLEVPPMLRLNSPFHAYQESSSSSSVQSSRDDDKLMRLLPESKNSDLDSLADFPQLPKKLRKEKSLCQETQETQTTFFGRVASWFSWSKSNDPVPLPAQLPVPALSTSVSWAQKVALGLPIEQACQSPSLAPKAQFNTVVDYNKQVSSTLIITELGDDAESEMALCAQYAKQTHQERKRKEKQKEKKAKLVAIASTISRQSRAAHRQSQSRNLIYMGGSVKASAAREKQKRAKKHQQALICKQWSKEE